MSLSVSLIITCHNQHNYLQELLWLLGKYEDMLHDTEIIIADSSDENFSPPDEIQYYKIPNRGPSAARNFGVSKAKGEWISFCDADDFVNPYMIKYVEQLKGVSGDSFFFDFKWSQDEEIVAAARRYYASLQLPAEVRTISIKDPVFFLQKFFPVHAILIRRSVFEKVRFNDEQWFIEDVRFYLELSLITGIELFYCGDEVFYSFHREFKNRQSLSGSNEQMFWRGISSNYRYLTEHGNLNIRQKIQLVKLLVLNYHIVRKELQQDILEYNKMIWNFFFGLPHLLRNKIIFKAITSVTRVGR